MMTGHTRHPAQSSWGTKGDTTKPSRSSASLFTSVAAVPTCRR